MKHKLLFVITICLAGCGESNTKTQTTKDCEYDNNYNIDWNEIASSGKAPFDSTDVLGEYYREFTPGNLTVKSETKLVSDSDAVPIDFQSSFTFSSKTTPDGVTNVSYDFDATSGYKVDFKSDSMTIKIQAELKAKGSGTCVVTGNCDREDYEQYIQHYINRQLLDKTHKDIFFRIQKELNQKRYFSTF